MCFPIQCTTNPPQCKLNIKFAVTAVLCRGQSQAAAAGCCKSVDIPLLFLYNALPADTLQGDTSFRKP